MGIVTKLEIQKRNKKRVSVYIDEEYAFSLSFDEAARLSKGQTLSDAEVTTLMNQSAVGLAQDRALRLLSLRPRSIGEVRQNLARHGTATPVIDAVIERLSQVGYLDDRAFAALWIDERMRSKPTSPRALRYELRQKGIESAVIDAALADLDDAEAAYRAAAAHMKKLRRTTARDFRDRLRAHLLRRGFSAGRARQAVARLLDEIEADMPDFFADDESGEDHLDD